MGKYVNDVDELESFRRFAHSIVYISEFSIEEFYTIQMTILPSESQRIGGSQIIFIAMFWMFFLNIDSDID